MPVEGICLYPILDYPGWDNERPCEVGLLSAPDSHGHRTVCRPLAQELRRQRRIFARSRAGTIRSGSALVGDLRSA